MKTHSMRFHSILALTGGVLLSAQTIRAADLTWDLNGALANQTDGAGAWLTPDLWWDGTSNVSWTSADNAFFGNGGAGGAVTLASPTTVGSLTFDYFTGTYTLGTAGQALTLNSGITKNAGSGVVTIISPLILGGAQTWTNNATTALNINAAVTLSGNLTIGGTGNTVMNSASAVIGGTGDLIKNGTGNISHGGNSPAHNFTGNLIINGGSISSQSNAWLTGRNTSLTNGYIGGRFGSGFTWTSGLGTGANQIQITGRSGFSGEGGSNSAFQIGGALSTLIWGASGEGAATGFFNATALIANGDANMNSTGVGSLNNAINLNGSDRTITSLQTTNGGSASGFTISGAISNGTGTAGLIKTGVGNLILAAANTYNGATTINGGSITLSAAAATINSSNALNLGGGTLRLVNTANTQRFADGATITVSAGGGINYENATGTVVYTETLGAATVSGGQFNVNLTINQAGTGSQTLTLGGLSQSGTGSVTFSAATTGPQITGNKNMIVVSGAGTTNANEIIGSWATIGTTAALQTDYAVYNSDYVTAANIAASAQSTWTATTAATSNYTMSALASGTISGGTKNINTVRSTNNSVTVTASSPDIALASHTLAVGDIVTFSAATMPTGLTAGTPYYVVATGAGTIQVSATSSGGAITPTTTGTTVVAAGGILLSSGNNLGTTGILNGSATTLNILATGTGAITLPTTTAGVLSMNAGSGGITVSAPIINNTGALSLAKSGSGLLILNGANTFTGNLAINAGTLQIGTNGVANNATLGNTGTGTGTYAGNIFIGAGANLDYQSNSTQILSGIISGDGNLLQRYSGTLTLGDDNTYTGKTTIGAITNTAGATLVVSSFNSVNGGTPLLANSSLGAPTTIANGTIEMGSNNSGPTQTLKYAGVAATGETTDRVINFIFNGSAQRTLDASGSGLLKFTSPFTSTGLSSGVLNLTGTGNGELAGLPFLFGNLTKSGTGTWTIGGVVGNTGITTVSANGGTLALQKKSSLLGGNTANWTAAKIVVNSGGTLALNVGSSGEFRTGDVTTILTNLGGLGGAITNNGLRSGSTIGFNTTNASGGTHTIANDMANSTGTGGGAIGLSKLGTGKLVLTGTNTYTGATTVSAGKLAVNGSLGNTAVTVQSGATLQGSGVIAGSVTIQNGGTLATGNSIESLATGDLTLAAAAIFAYEMDNSAAALASGDLTAVTGNLTLDLGNASILNLAELGAGAWTAGESLTLISYSGTWNGGLFTYNSSTLADGSTINFSGMDWTFDYDDTSAGDNYTSDLTGTSFVTMTAIPEPKAALVGALGVLLLLRRRRN